MQDVVLVTGVAGFIGFHTAKTLLDKNVRVVGIDIINDYYDPALKHDRLKELHKYDDFSFHKEDITNLDGLQKIWAEDGPFLNVIHLAAQPGVRASITNPYPYIHSNIVGHFTILEMCRHTEGFQHLVYASSSSVYGGNTKMPFAVNDRVDKPVSLYAATKKCDELMSYSYSHLYKIPQTGLRFFTAYGPWGRPDMAYFLFAKSMVEGKTITVFNNGDMKRVFTYIDDIVSGLLGVLEKPPVSDNDAVPYRILNIGNHKSENLMTLIRTIESALGIQANIEFASMQAGDVKDTFADFTETTELTGYLPTTGIDKGIPAFVEWFKTYYDIKSA